MRVEFYRLLDDQTWDTFIEKLPDLDDEVSGGHISSDFRGVGWECVPEVTLDEYLRDYTVRVLSPQTCHRKAVIINVYTYGSTLDHPEDVEEAAYPGSPTE